MRNKSQYPTSPVEISHGSVTVKIYRNTNRDRVIFSVIYYEGSERKQRNFARFEKAKAEAKQIARQLSFGHGTAMELTGRDRDNYLHAKGLLDDLGLPLGVAMDQFVAAMKRLNGASLADAVGFYVEKKASKLASKLVSEVVEEFLASKEQDRLSLRYLETCQSHLKRFSEAFRGYIGNVDSSNIDSWLRSLKVAPRTRNNIRGTVATLFSFAKTRGYLPKGDTEADAVPLVRVRGGRIGIFTATELQILLMTANERILPALAIGAFAGIRIAEIRRLNWHDIKFEQGHIQVAADQSKNPYRRIVPLLPVLAAWLRPLAKMQGPILTQQLDRSVSAAIRAVRKKAGLVWKHNGLRHSFGSYRHAIIQDIAKLACEMGNSPQIIKSNYLQVVTRQEAEKWFNVFPAQGDGKVVSIGAGTEILPQPSASSPDAVLLHGHLKVS